MQYAPVTFTDLGARKVQEFLAAQDTDTSDAGLRLGVRGGGCSGVPFMKRMTLFSWMAPAMASRSGFCSSLMGSPS